MTQARTICKSNDCILKNLLLEDMNLSELQSICKSRETKYFFRGMDIICEGDNIQNIIYLKSGLIKLFKHHKNHQDQIITICRPDTFVGLLSVFSESSYKYTITAIENSEVCFINIPSFKDFITNNGYFALNILARISKTTDDIIATNLEIGKKNLRGRVAFILLFFSKNIYDSASFELPLSRKEFAEFIDMTTENVIRIISEFAKDKVLKVKRKQIEVLDLVKLQKICDLG